MPDKCPVCNTELKKKNVLGSGLGASAFSCYRCGDFVLKGRLISTLPSILQEHKDAETKISHALRLMQRINEKVELSASMIDAILEKPLPRPQEQADLLIRWLAEHSDSPGDQVCIEPKPHLSIIGAKTKKGFFWFFLI